MYLRHVRLHKWACHDALSIDLDPGLNVCVGPNGVGKSTLYRAIVTALTTKHSSRGEEVRELLRWGEGAQGPGAVLEVIRPDGSWRLSKTFLHQPACTLERKQGTWVMQGQGRQAESTLEGWLDADGTAGRLVLALWSPQADPTRVLDGATRSGSIAPATVLDRVVAQFEQAEAAGPFAILKGAVASQYASFFTPKEARVRQGSELDRARRDLAEAERVCREIAARQSDLADRLASYQARRTAHERDCNERASHEAQREARAIARLDFTAKAEALRAAEEAAAAARGLFEQRRLEHERLLRADADLARVETDLQALAPRLEEARADLQAAAEALHLAEHRLTASAPKLDELAAALDRQHELHEARDRNRQRQHALSSRRQDCEEARAAVSVAVERIEAARREVARLEQAAAAADQARRRAELTGAEDRFQAADRAFRVAERNRLRAERTRLAGRLDQLHALDAERAALDPAADGGPIPPAEVLARLAKLAADLEIRTRGLAADSLTIQFAPEAPGIVARLTADDQEPTPRTLAIGEILEAQAIGSLVLEIAGVGTVRVGRTSPERAAQQAELERDRLALVGDLRAWGVDDLAALQQRRQRADARALLEQRTRQLLAGETPGSLQAQLARLDAALSEPDPEAAPSSPPVPSEPTTTDLDTLREFRESAARALAAARARCELDPASSSGDGVLDTSESDPAPAPLDPAEIPLRLRAAREELKTVTSDQQEAEAALAEAQARLVAAIQLERESSQELASMTQGVPVEQALCEREIHVEGLRAVLRPHAADPAGNTPEAVRIKKTQLQRSLDEARSRHEQLARDLGELDRRHVELATRRTELANRCRELCAELSDAVDSEARERNLAHLRQRSHEADAMVEVRRKELPPDPSADDEAFQAACQALEARCRDGERELARLLGELDLLGAEGFDTQQARAEEHLEACRLRRDRLEREAAAWALLQHVLAEVESAQARGTAARVAALAADVLPRLTGQNVAGVVLDPRSLAPVKAQVQPDGLAARIERFSQGTREQVALACRIQIGLLLAREARHMLLLDDPLAHTDPDRHREALDVLADLTSQNLQVLIFTCHRDRYAPLWEDGPGHLIELGPALTATV